MLAIRIEIQIIIVIFTANQLVKDNARSNSDIRSEDARPAIILLQEDAAQLALKY